MQLGPFEALLQELLTPHVTAVRTFADGGVGFLYGLEVKTTDGATVLLRLTRGSGTGDVKLTAEQAEAHAANVARLDGASQALRPTATAAQNRQVEDLVRQLLLDAPVPDATAVGELPAGKTGVKISFSTGSAVFISAIDR